MKEKDEWVREKGREFPTSRRKRKIIMSVLGIQVAYSLFFGIVAYFLIPRAARLLLESGNLFGNDLNKPHKPKIPESLGVFIGATFMVCMVLFIPVPFISGMLKGTEGTALVWLASYLGGLLSISCMIFLGFADDVLNLRWRDKLFLPAIASLPLLMVYYVTNGKTVVVVPIFLRNILGMHVELGTEPEDFHHSIPTFFVNRPIVLHLYGNACCILYQCYQHSCWY